MLTRIWHHMLLNNAANAEGRKYREAYAAPNQLLAFLLAIMSTSGQFHGEFLRLLHILSHRKAVNFFELFGEETTDNACTFRCAAYFFHNRATTGPYSIFSSCDKPTNQNKDILISEIQKIPQRFGSPSSSTKVAPVAENKTHKSPKSRCKALS